MKGKALRVICVGRLKTVWWKQACEHYIKLINHWRPLECVETRDGEASLDQVARNAREGQRILAFLENRDTVIALCEEGEKPDSRQLANILRKFDLEGRRRLNFVIGGPFGLDAAVLARANMRLSLSALTWPHELARVLLLEQLYRAESILRGLPYHH